MDDDDRTLILYAAAELAGERTERAFAVSALLRSALTLPEGHSVRKAAVQCARVILHDVTRWYSEGS